VLKRLVGDEGQWLWALEEARTLMRQFADLRAIDRVGNAADFALSHNATQQAAGRYRHAGAREGG